jgi:hypothetical protein
MTSSINVATVKLLIVVDGNYSSITAGRRLRIGISSFWFSPSTYNVYDTFHRIAFYVVNDCGDVSEPQTLYLNGSPVEEDTMYVSPAMASSDISAALDAIFAMIVASTVLSFIRVGTGRKRTIPSEAHGNQNHQAIPRPNKHISTYTAACHDPRSVFRSTYNPCTASTPKNGCQ